MESNKVILIDLFIFYFYLSAVAVEYTGNVILLRSYP